MNFSQSDMFCIAEAHGQVCLELSLSFWTLCYGERNWQIKSIKIKINFLFPGLLGELPDLPVCCPWEDGVAGDPVLGADQHVQHYQH